MGYKLDYNIVKQFYINFKEFPPMKIQILMFATLGLYLIRWVYINNRKFEQFSENVPDSNRGAVLMLIFPLFWLVIIWFLKKFIEDNEFIKTIEISGWLLIMFLILQYLYEFCYAYGEFTRTNGLVWYYTIFPGFLALILIPLGFWYTLPLLFFPYMSIPAMQGKLNYETKRTSLNYVKNEFYRLERKIL